MVKTIAAYPGIFTISLDFELYWGVRDKLALDHYKPNLEGVEKAVSEILRVFSKYSIHATWATVGFLLCKNIEEIVNNRPVLLPTYRNRLLSPYDYIDNNHHLEAKYHFAPHLVERILGFSGQEIATHTYSHYYTLEEGQTLAQFEEDIRLALHLAQNKRISVNSLVFPRNQCNPQYFFVLNKLGIQCYRGNEKGWMFSTTTLKPFRRLFRLLDSYVNLSGYNTYTLEECLQTSPFNFPSSRYLRPYSRCLRAFDWLRLKRIKIAMNDAAIHKKVFHLWWHPHNFGRDIEENIIFLSSILDHFLLLKNKYGMLSLNMQEMSSLAGVRNVQ